MFKPLLDSRLQGFLSFNADANQLLRSGSCEIRLGVPDLQQARQAITAPFSQLRAGGAWMYNQNSRHQSPTSGGGFSSDQFDSGHFDPSLSSLGASGGHRGSVQQIMKIDGRGSGGGGGGFDSSDLFGSLGTQTMNGSSVLATSAPTSTNGFGGQHDSKVFILIKRGKERIL